MSNKMKNTINMLTKNYGGILAADESNNTIGKRFKLYNINNSEENRKKYREIIFTTKDIEKYITGIILYQETMKQKCNNIYFTDLLLKKGILPGIKIDSGTIPLFNNSKEYITNGLDDIHIRLEEAKKYNAVYFAKWRAVFIVKKNLYPSNISIRANIESLSRYAAICQSKDIVPIVEPEILMDGNHSIEDSYKITVKILNILFNNLYTYKVNIKYIILKPSMVINGSSNNISIASSDKVAHMTIEALKYSVPSIVPSINFLSGGQKSFSAINNLNSMNKLFSNLPWKLSFSFGRALHIEALKQWSGKKENIKSAQEILIKRIIMSHNAVQGTLK